MVCVNRIMIYTRKAGFIEIAGPGCCETMLYDVCAWVFTAGL